LAQFVFIPYGTVIEKRQSFIDRAREAGKSPVPVLVTAGRSGRDYATAIAAIAGMDVTLRIICDHAAAIPDTNDDPRVQVLSHCHGDDYLATMASADIVLVPLATTDVSSGQMVLLQAKALARPVIVSDTPTIRDYATPGVDAVLVPIHDPAALRQAIETLLTDQQLRERLQQGAEASFERLHTLDAFYRRQIEVIEDRLTRA
jgi:glycosyltransferase involved in cell wall biosynthesis